MHQMPRKKATPNVTIGGGIPHTHGLENHSAKTSVLPRMSRIESHQNPACCVLEVDKLTEMYVEVWMTRGSHRDPQSTEPGAPNACLGQLACADKRPPTGALRQQTGLSPSSGCLKSKTRGQAGSVPSEAPSWLAEDSCFSLWPPVARRGRALTSSKGTLPVVSPPAPLSVQTQSPHRPCLQVPALPGLGLQR